MARRLSNYLMLAAAAAARCEVLRSLDFQQHTAPKGVSELLGPVVSLVSEKAEVGDIKIRWDGELGLHRVGTHKIVAENSDGACFETIIVVKDTNECTATGAWRHIPVPLCARRLGEGAVPVALRLADDLKELSRFAAYLKPSPHAIAATGLRDGTSLTHLLLYDGRALSSFPDRRRHHFNRLGILGHGPRRVALPHDDLVVDAVAAREDAPERRRAQI